MAQASPLPCLRFDSTAIDTGDRFAAWREHLSALFDVSLEGDEAPDGFAGSLTTYHMGTMLLARGTSGGQGFERDHRRIARTGSDHYLIQLYAEGGYVGTTGPGDIVMRPGDVCVLDMARPVKTRASAFENITLVVPRESLAPLVAAPDALHGLVLPGASAAGAMLGDHLRSLYRHAGDLPAADAPAITRGTVTLAAGCLGPALAAQDVVQPAMHTARLSAAKRYIEKRLAEPTLGPPQICRDLGLSRATLYRLFEPLGGVQAYIRERRLARAFVDLITPERSRHIGVIAYDWGFGSAAAFSSAFRAAFGMSPREVRTASASLATLLADSVVAAGPTTELEGWLRGLAAA